MCQTALSFSASHSLRPPLVIYHSCAVSACRSCWTYHFCSDFDELSTVAIAEAPVRVGRGHGYCSLLHDTACGAQCSAVEMYPSGGSITRVYLLIQSMLG